MGLLPEYNEAREQQKFEETVTISDRAERARIAIIDAYQAWTASGVQATSEDIRSMAITFIIEEQRTGKVAGLVQNYSKPHAEPIPIEHPVTPVQQPTYQAPVQPRTQGVTCPHCGSATYDNRLTKTNPKGPDYKCRNTACSAGAWVNKETGAPKWGKPSPR